MHFDLDAEQQQLQDSLRRLLDSEASFERRRQAAQGVEGHDPALWRKLCELGIAAITLPEVHGGFAQAPIALLPVLQELGRALALTPFLSTAVLGATAVVRAGSAAQQEALLPGLADGSRLLAFAHEEAGARQAPLWVETRASRQGERWTLSGDKIMVLHGASAQQLVVSARTKGAADEDEGLVLFVVDADQPGVRRTALRLIDDTPAAEIRFEQALAQPLGDPSDHVAAADALQAVQEAGIAAVCAEALGVVEKAFALTVDYVQSRQQFGRAIGTNQALRHRVAEMRLALDMVRSAAMAGLLALEQEDAVQRARELSRAKMLVSRHAGFIAQQGIQLHGGIGMTVEYAVGHCLRRITVIEQLFGDGPAHAARLGAALAADRLAA